MIAGGFLSGGALAQSNPAAHNAPTYLYPESNKKKQSDIGFRAHTNVVGLSFPKDKLRKAAVRPNGVPVPGEYYETPSSLACVYGFVSQTTGCNPANANAVVTGGSGLAIAIVDAYDNPDITTDLAAFATQFGLPTPSNFQVVYATGTKPPVDSTGWSLESSLDVEWAFAMSPNAKKIYLVEAASNSDSDLLKAVDVATTLVTNAGGGVVSMSWGGPEFSGEAANDSHFQHANVTYLASTGDAPGTEWPSVSAYVVAVGGTSISRNPANGNFVGEQTWQQTGGGPSLYVKRPAYQNAMSSVVGAYRGVPDIAAVADPDTAVWVYAQYACTVIYPGYCAGNWIRVGGTSAAAPIEAAVMSHKGVKYAAVLGALNAIYSGSMGNLRDITIGNCGPYAGYAAGVSWDFCTGRGSFLGANRMLAVVGSINP